MWLKMCLLKNLFVGAVRRWSSGDDPSALKFEKRDSYVVARHSGAFLFFLLGPAEKMKERFIPK